MAVSGRKVAKDSHAKRRVSTKWTVQPSAKLFSYWCYRWGYVPVKQEISEVLGVGPSVVSNKIHHIGFHDTEKVILAKEFELTTQEFCELFFPGVFREDGTIILDRDPKTKGVKPSKTYDIYPMQGLR